MGSDTHTGPSFDVAELRHGLPSLQTLKLRKCAIGISGLGAIVQGCTSLTELDVSGCELKKLPDDFGGERLSSLQHLDLSNNLLAALPPSITTLTALTRFNLVDNQRLREPPMSVIRQGDDESVQEQLASIGRYFRDLGSGGGFKSFNGSLILVGDGEAGKTSLLRRAMNSRSSLPKPDERTIAVDSYDWQLEMRDAIKLWLRCWDMGGQVAYHGVQQLFVNASALFNLVISAMNDNLESGIVHWLQMIAARCPTATVLPVITKLGCVEYPEDRKHRIVQQLQRSKLPPTTSDLFIASPMDVCAKSLKGVDEFRAKVIELLDGSGRFENVGITVPSKWVRCRNLLDALRNGADPLEAVKRDPAVDLLRDELSSGAPRDFIFRSELAEMWAKCSASFVHSMEDRTTMLDDVLEKVCVPSGEVLILKDMIHLKPLWLVDLVKPLADHQLSPHENSRGEMRPASHRRTEILQAATKAGYSEVCEAVLDEFIRTGFAPLWLLQALWHKLDKVASDEFVIASLIDTLVENGVLFPTATGTDFVVTFRLPRTSPKALQIREERFNFPFVPPSFIERLIARLHELGDLKHHWKGGAMLTVKVEEGCGVYDFTDTAVWMQRIGVHESRAREYASALKEFEVKINGTVTKCQITTAEELTKHIEHHGRKLPPVVDTTDEQIVRQAVSKLTDDERKAYDEETEGCDIETTIADFGVNSSHSEKYARDLSFSPLDLIVHVESGKPLPVDMSKCDGDFIVESIIKSPVRPTEWKGEANLRLGLDEDELTATAQGEPWLVDRVLSAVRTNICDMKAQFPGLTLEVEPSSKEEEKQQAAEILLLLLARKKLVMPTEVYEKMPLDSIWRKNANQVQSWLKLKPFPALKGKEKVLRCDGKALLALILPANKDIKIETRRHQDLLRKTGFFQGLKLGEQLSKHGSAFWNLVSRELKSGVTSPQLTKYSYDCKLGNGAFGEVFSLQHGMRRVALKNQRPPSLKELAELRNESELQQKVSNCNYVVACESGFRVGLNYLMLVEFCPGGELSDWLGKQTGATLPDLWRLIAEMVAGLVHVHSKLIIHRDLKPPNGELCF